MSSARAKLLEVLESRPEGLTLQELSVELTGSNALGFGVETEDVVSALSTEGKIAYDPSRDLVTLRTRS